MARHYLLLTVAPLALLSQPAWAQDPTATQGTQDTTTAADSADAQTETRSPEAAAKKKPAPTSEDIVVTGYRASLRSAQQIKRNSDAIVDAIVADDIGKLPDVTAAESIARVTGVQINRYSDEANGVLVRGLPDVATTFNGREIFTAELRRSQLQDFPSGALAGLEVYKSGTADLLEGGLAGLINVRTRRPFDFSDFTVAGNVRYTYNDQNKKYDPHGNILISDRMDTKIGEIGWLLNASYDHGTWRNAVRWGSGTIVEPGTNQPISPASIGRDFQYPERVGVWNDGGERWRPSANASFQWKPASNLEIYSDLLFQGYRGRNAGDMFEVSLRNAEPALSNVVLVDGKPDQVQSMTVTTKERAQMFRSTGSAYTNTYQGAAGAKWNLPGVRLSTDLAYTWSEYRSDTWSFDTATTSNPVVDVNFFVDDGTAFSLPGFDASDPANYKWRGYYEAAYYVKGKGWQWRGDAEFDTGWSWMPKFQAGFRWTDRFASLDRGDRYAYTESLNIPLADMPVGELGLTQDVFRGNVQGWRNWLMPSRSGIAGNSEVLRQLSYEALQQIVPMNPGNGWFAEQMAKFSKPEVEFDQFAGFRAKESTYTAYLQGKYQFDIGSVGIDGLFGLRAVNTDGRYSGISSEFIDGVRTTKPNSLKQDYTDWLPNVSMRIRPTDKLQVRLGFTETRTKPEFSQLRPATDITQNMAPIPDDATPEEREQWTRAYINGGNPDLKALTSRNYDATVEYYFSKSGSLTAAVFYRDLWGFINNYTRKIYSPEWDGYVQVSRPENAGDGKIKGFEIAGQTFFDFLPGFLSGFGVQGNLTYIKGKNRLPSTLGGDAPYVKIPGVSKWTYNAALFYEKGKISTRLSYNGRSDFVNWYGQSTLNGGFTGEATRKISRLDFSFSYTPIEPLTVAFDASNLLAKPFINYRQYADDRYYPRDIRDEGRYFGVGARFRFGPGAKGAGKP